MDDTFKKAQRTLHGNGDMPIKSARADTQNQNDDEALEAFRQFLRFPSFITGGHPLVSWSDDGAFFAWIDSDSTPTVLVVDAESGKRSQVSDALLRNDSDVELVPERLTFESLSHELLVSGGRGIVGINLDSGATTWKEIPNVIGARRLREPLAPGLSPTYEVLSPDSQWALGDDDNNLYIRRIGEDDIRFLTSNGSPELTWTVVGARWSPDGTAVVAMMSDFTGVPRLPVINWLGKHERIDSIPYSRTGDPTAAVTVNLIDPQTGEQQVVLDDAASGSRYEVSGFRPGCVYLTRLNRTKTVLDVLSVDLTTGKADKIVHDEYGSFLASSSGGLTELSCPLVTLLPTKDLLILRSEREGRSHLYLYNLEGKFLRDLTPGELVVDGVEMRPDPPETLDSGLADLDKVPSFWHARQVQDVVAVDEIRGWVYFLAHIGPRHYDTHLFRTRIADGQVDRLTTEIGTHEIQFSPDFSKFVDTHSSVVRPPQVELRAADGRWISQIDAADTRSLDLTGWTPPEEVVMMAADGTTELNGVIYRPADFDESKQYATIDCIYGGPQLSNVPRRFWQDRARLAVALARAGFVCVVIDARGTPCRDKAFHDTVFRSFGQNEIPDHSAALRQLIESHSFIDPNRIGITGRSWGGYMSIRAMLLEPAVYKVGVAQVPVADLDDHEGFPIEPYMDLPTNNPEGYARASNLQIAHRLEGKLLIACGTEDVDAPFSCTMKLAAAFTAAGRPFDLSVYPGESHRFGAASDDHFLTSLLKYFRTYL